MVRKKLSNTFSYSFSTCFQIFGDQKYALFSSIYSERDFLLVLKFLISFNIHLGFFHNLDWNDLKGAN